MTADWIVLTAEQALGYCGTARTISSTPRHIHQGRGQVRRTVFVGKAELTCSQMWQDPATLEYHTKT